MQKPAHADPAVAASSEPARRQPRSLVERALDLPEPEPGRNAGIHEPVAPGDPIDWQPTYDALNRQGAGNAATEPGAVAPADVPQTGDARLPVGKLLVVLFTILALALAVGAWIKSAPPDSSTTASPAVTRAAPAATDQADGLRLRLDDKVIDPGRRNGAASPAAGNRAAQPGAQQR